MAYESGAASVDDKRPTIDDSCHCRPTSALPLIKLGNHGVEGSIVCSELYLAPPLNIGKISHSHQHIAVAAYDCGLPPDRAIEAWRHQIGGDPAQPRQHTPPLGPAPVRLGAAVPGR